jgi:Mn2+/Fe2+ NRAMP family transporter
MGRLSVVLILGGILCSVGGIIVSVMEKIGKTPLVGAGAAAGSGQNRPPKWAYVIAGTWFVLGSLFAGIVGGFCAAGAGGGIIMVSRNRRLSPARRIYLCMVYILASAAFAFVIVLKIAGN